MGAGVFKSGDLEGALHGAEVRHDELPVANGAGEDVWSIGGGLSYNVDAWTVGLGYAHSEGEIDGVSKDRTVDRVGVTGNYEMGPGIDLDAGIFYTWADADNDDADANFQNYDSIEFAVGSSISF